MRKFQPWVLEYLFCNLQKWHGNVAAGGKTIKSPISERPQDLLSLHTHAHTRQNLRISYLVSLELPCSPLLIQIPPGCDATDRARHYRSTLATLDQRAALLAPSGYQGFVLQWRFSALTSQRPHMKGFSVMRGAVESIHSLSYTKASQCLFLSRILVPKILNSWLFIIKPLTFLL